jgi:hypothetical protein
VKTIFGILALLVGIWNILVFLRGLKPHHHARTGIMLRGFGLGEIVFQILLIIMFGGTGVLLLVNFNYWWILLPICLGLMFIWSAIIKDQIR